MFESMAHSAFSEWLLQSNSIWAYPTVLTLHTFGMMVLVGCASVIDLRLLGFARAIPLKSMGTLFTVTWWAFGLNAVTGTMLFIADADKRGHDPDFGLKMLLIAGGIATIVMIHKAIYTAPDEPVAVPSSVRRLAIVSLLCWGGAITAGRLLAYVA
jgi:hypothetical protein